MLHTMFTYRSKSERMLRSYERQNKVIPAVFKFYDHGGIFCERTVESIFAWNFSSQSSLCVVYTTLGDVNTQQAEEIPRISDKILYYCVAIKSTLDIAHNLRSYNCRYTV
jgi:hypothetical protein